MTRWFFFLGFVIWLIPRDATSLVVSPLDGGVVIESAVVVAENGAPVYAQNWSDIKGLLDQLPLGTQVWIRTKAASEEESLVEIEYCRDFNVRCEKNDRKGGHAPRMSLSKEPRKEGFYTKPKPVQTEASQCEGGICGQTEGPKEDLVLPAHYNLGDQIKGLAEIFEERLTHCGQRPSGSGRKSLKRNKKTSTPIYDQEVLPTLTQLFNKLAPPKPKCGSEELSFSEAISIDSMARTLLGEMGVPHCMDNVEYPMAVARVILNRADQGGSKFISKNRIHAEQKTQVSKVSTDSTQFHNWLTRGALEKSLCPSPSRTSHREPQRNYLQSQWRTALRVAIDAVCYGDSFRKKTSDLEDVFFFTSGRARIPGLKPIKKKFSIYPHPESKEARVISPGHRGYNTCLNFFKN